MKIRIEGHNTITGTPEAIIKVMHDARYVSTPKGEGYIAAVTLDAARIGIKLHVTGADYHERAISLLHEMADNGMIEIEEEN